MVEQYRPGKVTSSNASPAAYGGKLNANTMSSLLANAGVPDSWIPGMVEIARRESGFDPQAKNPSSTAYGLFQFLDGTWKDYGQGDRNNPVDQARSAANYIKQRYGNPDQALAFWDANKWY